MNWNNTVIAACITVILGVSWILIINLGIWVWGVI
jgi:hypothetical protein